MFLLLIAVVLAFVIRTWYLPDPWSSFHVAINRDVIASIALLQESILLLQNTSVIFLFPVVLALVIVLKHQLMYTPRQWSKLPPGTLGYPFVGEMLTFVKSPLIFYRRKAQIYGTPFLTHVILAPTVVMGGTDDEMRWLWNTERKGQTKISFPSHWQKLMGHGAMTNTTGKKHLVLRKIFEPAFSPIAMRSYVSIIDRTTQQALDQWASTGSYQSSTVFKIYVLRLFFECVFGVIDEDVLKEISHDFHIWLESHSTLIPIALPGTLLAKGFAARKRVIGVLSKMIVEFKNANPPGSELAQKSVLGRLCYQTDDEGNHLSDDDLSSNLLIIIFAGHDTTYCSIGSILHNLICNNTDDGKRVLNALVEEINSFKSLDRDTLDFDELKEAPILNAFLAESWRKDPPVAAGSKVALEDISYKNWIIPKGTQLHYSIHLGAYNEQRYPNPSEFHIERFLPKDHPLVKEAKWHVDDVDLHDTMKPSYPIFGGGTHGCLGNHFAKLEARILLTRMLQKYHVGVRNSKKKNFPFNFWMNEFKLTPR